MTDITININTGSENNEPRVTTNTDKSKSDIPKAEPPKEDTPPEVGKEETHPVNDAVKEETSEKDDTKKMDMTEEEHAKMTADKTKLPSEDIQKKEETHPKKIVHKKG